MNEGLPALTKIIPKSRPGRRDASATWGTHDRHYIFYKTTPHEPYPNRWMAYSRQRRRLNHTSFTTLRNARIWAAIDLANAVAER